MPRMLHLEMTWPQICERTAKQLREKHNIPAKQDFVDWMLTKENVSVGRIAGPTIYYLAYRIAKKFEDEEDHFTAIVGATGSGKSWAGAAIAALVSPTFSIKHILFDPVTMIDAFLNAKKGDTIMIDEGALFLFSREALSKNNKMATKIFTICRVLGLHVIVCLPEFKSLDSYVRMDRIHTLILMTARGHPKVHSKSAINIINEVYPQKKKNIKSVKIPQKYWFSGRTNKQFPKINDLSAEAYKAHKKANVKKTLKDMHQSLVSESKTLYNTIDEGVSK